MKAAVAAAAAVRQASPRTTKRFRRALSQTGETDLQGIVDLLRSVCEVEIAAIGVLDQGAFHYLVLAGTDPLSNPVELSLCQHSMTTPGVFVIPDTHQDERTRDNPFANGVRMTLRFYASAPVNAPDGTTVGRLCLFDTRPRELAPVPEQALLTLADVVGKILQLRLDRLDEAEAIPLGRDLEMAARVSHDLRLPLAALEANLEMLEENLDGDAALADRLISRARGSVDRMSGLVDGLMRLHELTAEAERSEVDLAVVAARVCADLGPMVEEADAAVHIGALPTVRADPDLMYSALLNLVSNAVKFARPGVAPVVTMRSSRVDGGWRISVVDNGIGVPADQRETVFGLFTRLTDKPGHGIGLTTVAQIVRAHGGTTGVDDADGPGSEFWFELPDS
ncbi:ATP-binding protein [Nocardioides dilutus]